MGRAVILFMVLAAVSAALAVAGACLIAGAGAGFLVAAVAVGGAAELVRRGMIAGG